MVLLHKLSLVFYSKGLKNCLAVKHFDIYPNPITENANLNLNILNQSNVSYSVSDLLGQKIMSVDLGTIGAGDKNLSA